MAHTPGPWRYFRGGIVVADIPNGDATTTAVAYVRDEFRHTGGLVTGDEADANGALTAAAPDMLAALHGFLEHSEALDISGDKYWDADENVVAAARAAVAKAEGG